ncbi:MAG TPA: hypothetical protein GX404_08555 [Syntrophomonadaceae bacterium]|nr:hypothetical protein [Syntrophomonadaceae bacterium]
MKKRFLGCLLFFLVAMLLCTGGCSKENAEKKPHSSSTQEIKVPKELGKMEDELNVILASQQKMIEPPAAAPQENTQKQVGKESSGAQEAGGGKQEEQSSLASSGDQQQSSKQKDWQEIDKQLMLLHQSWNTVEPEAVRAGLAMEERDKWEESLSELTMAVEKKDLQSSIQASMQLYGLFSNFARIFKTPVPPEYYLVKYEAMKLAYNGLNDQWEQASTSIQPLQQHWDHLKLQKKDINSQVVDKTDFSLRDLEMVIDLRSKSLLRMKYQVLDKNLSALEKELSKM